MAQPIHLPRAIDDSTATGTGFARLSPDIQRAVGKRLMAAAIVYTGAWIAVFVGMFGEHVARGERLLPAHLLAMSPDLVAAVLSTVAVVFLVRSGRLSPTAFLNVSLAYQLLGAFLICRGFWGWESNAVRYFQLLGASGADIDMLHQQGFPGITMDGIPWVGIWILMFPLIVPTPPLRAALGAFASASMIPVISLLSVWSHGMSELLSPWATQMYWEYFVPGYIVAAIAVFGAHVVYRMTRDLSRAQELGSYQLIEPIGEGGMGEVWRAKHRLLARPGAIKLIRPKALSKTGGAPDPTVLKRFEREAQATAALESPHTIELYDFGVTPDGTFYYVMELLDGLDLRTLVESHGPIPAERAVHILRQASHSLMDAHQAGLIHRDVKPANIFICRRGPDHDFVKVLDFGLVKEFGVDDRTPVQLTQEGVASGTPTFMAPEMASADREVDGRADLYALGCVGYWLLTGQLVFEGRSALEVMIQHVKDAPPPPSTRTDLEIPEAVEELILALLAKEPEKRPESATEVYRRLGEIQESLPPWSEDKAARWWTTHRPQPTR